MVTLSAALAAVEKKDGNVARACELLKCSRVEFYRKAHEWPKLMEAVKAAREGRRQWRQDKAKSNVDEALENGEPWATRLVLAADPEFAERTVQDGEHTVTVKVVRVDD